MLDQWRRSHGGGRVAGPGVQKGASASSRFKVHREELLANWLAVASCFLLKARSLQVHHLSL